MATLRRWTVRARWPLVFLAIAGLVGWAAVAYQRAELRAAAAQQLAIVAELKRSQLIGWLEGQRILARSVSEGTVMALEVEQWLDAGRPGGPPPRWLARLRAIQEPNGYLDVSLLSLEGELLLSSAGKPLTFDPPEAEAARETARTGRPALTSVHRDPDFQGGLVALDFVAPMLVADAAGRRAVALMVLRMDAARALFRPLRSWPASSESGEVVLVERRGDQLVFLTDPLHQAGAALDLTVPLSRAGALLVHAADGRRGLLEGEDYRGVPSLGVGLDVPGTPWLIVAKQDRAELLAQFVPRTLRTGALALTFLLAVLLAVVAWLRQRAGVVAARQVEEARLMLETVLDAIPARVFWKDRQHRFLGCNRAFAGDAGLTPEQVMGKDDLAFPWAAHAARYQADDRTVMESGQPRFGFEEPLTRADGQTVWRRTNKVPLRGPDGEVRGVLGISEDLTPQKAAEAAAREGQALMQAVFENAGFGIAITDPEGRFIGPNPGWAKFLGYSVDELHALRNVDVTYLADVPESQRQLKRVYDGETNGYTLEKRYVRKDGAVVWGLLAVSAIRDAQGQVQSVIGIVADITERKRIEAELASTAERLELATQSAGIGIWDWDVLHDVLVWDDSMYRLYGLRREDFSGAYDAWTRALDPADRQRAQDAIQAALRGEHEFAPEFRIRWPDGSVHHLQATARTIRDQAGHAVRMVGVNLDVTARREAAERIRQSERFLKAVTDALPGLVGYYGRDLRCTFANASYREWFGRAPEELIGLTLREILGEALYRRNEPYARAALAGEPQRFEQNSTRPDGAVSYAWVHYIPDAAGGEVRGFFVLVSDITELKATQLELERLNSALQGRTRQAEAASRAKSDFLANMSHEIRTPMNAIMGLNQLLARSELGPKQRDYLDRMRAACRNLLALINDILDLSKIEAQKLELERVPFELHDVLRQVEGLTTERAREKGLALRCELAGDVPVQLVGDPLRLGQVLLNLASNAVKFTERGSVDLSVQLLGSDGERVRLRFAVRDTGIGIAPEALPLVFDAFSQADSSTTRRFGGTGLGLAISRRLVALMGGELSVQSSVGEGSTFSFELPLALQRRAPAARGGLLSGRRVLVVDNDREFCAVVGALLSTLGMEVRSAASGAEAIEVLAGAGRQAGQAYDVVLLDWRMPDVDGVETARRIRAERLDPPPLLVLTTAFAREYLGLGEEAQLFDGYALKPIEPDVLRSVLEEALRTRRAGDGAARRVGTRASGGQGRVLVAEDNETNRMVAREFLEGAGLAVEEACNGREAVDLALAPGAVFDLVLMDIQMPEMDGYEATARIHAVHPEVPIVAMTAHALEPERRRCLEAGMKDHLAKPFEAVEFLQVIERWLHPAAGAAGVDRPPQDPPRRAPAGPEAERFMGALRRDVASSVARLRAARAAADGEEARAAVHSIKGLALPVAHQGLHLAARALERAVRGGEPWLAQAAAVEEAARPLLASVAPAPEPAATAAAATSLTGAEREALRPLLEALAAKLRRRSLGAKEHADALRARLGAEPRVVALEAALEEVRFGDAEAALRALAESLGLALE